MTVPFWETQAWATAQQEATHTHLDYQAALNATPVDPARIQATKTAHEAAEQQLAKLRGQA